MQRDLVLSRSEGALRMLGAGCDDGRTDGSSPILEGFFIF